MSVTYAASCLCGRVRYELDTEPGITVACHCSLCRKATGSGRRMFCGHCGTTLGNLTTRRPAFMHLAAGTRAPALRIKFHVYVGLQGVLVRDSRRLSEIRRTT